MQKLRKFLPKTWWASVLWIVLTYVLFADVLPNLLLLLINCSGYLPYSDRPGPGWQAPHWPERQELSFFFGFALYMGIPTLIYAAGQTVLGLVFGFCSLPKWAIRMCGGIIGFLAAGLLMEGAGWMIAISALGIYVAAGCGFVWGLLVLPLLVVSADLVRPLAMRIGLPLTLLAGGIAYLVYPLLPKAPTPAINFELTRVTSGTELVKAPATDFLKLETQKEMNALHLRGQTHGGIQSGMGGSENGGSVDVVLLTEEPIDREYVLDIPASGHVVYVLQGGKLTAYPVVQKKLKTKIILRRGSDKQYEGGSLKVGDAPHFQDFTWYPAILK